MPNTKAQRHKEFLFGDFLKKRALPLCLGVFVLSASGSAQESPKDLEFFEKKIRPLLTERCYSCHSAKAEKLKGGLYADSREGLLKGGDSGSSIVAGDAKKSLLMKAVRWVDEDLKMPPKKRLSEEQIADLDAWIARGAAWPAGDKSTVGKHKQVGLSIEEGKKFWAYKAPLKPAEGGVDRLIAARLAAAKVAPAPAADKAVLLRRVYFDLVGLPPTPEQVDAFVNDPAPDAYEKAVDRLLASP